ncbi:9996_t:CDS:2 [Gigaspora margarita]|uniref:9996_t:CDS:1 n=1 Tax=Gigaspora margarita TaxID=4874 RepID=A0ABN7URH4_GIGMA|nr:9996_t:CDS:2 [Gigaspora margarita]
MNEKQERETIIKSVLEDESDTIQVRTSSGWSYDDPLVRISYSITDACLPFKTEKKTRAVVNFWYDIQQSIAVRHALLGHLSAFGASVKKSRVDGQDSQLDNDNEQSSANIQDSRLANYSEQSPSASAFSDHVNLEDETNCTTDNNNIKKHHPKWREIISTNPYAMNKPQLSQEVLSSLCKAANRHLSHEDVFMECGESDLNRLVALMFNNLIPEIAPQKLFEEKHCDMFIIQLLILFIDPKKNTNLN